MSDYSKLAAQLSTVRRAWKRRAAMAGLAMVLLESVAVFTLILLVDYLYQPPPVFRVALFVVALAAIVALAVKHVLTPLMRKIPDEQLALYVEEHRKDFQGALMTAAEYGQGHHATADQASLIAAVVEDATSRAARVNLPGVVDLRRLRKYGVAAALLVVGYAGMCLVFPQSVGHHAARVLAPWRPTAEDLEVARRPTPDGRTFQELAKAPITFTLSKRNVRLPRGSTFDVEAALSRAADGPVVLQFRAAADGDKVPWRELAMKEVDKLHGFSGSLKDVNEDLQFRIVSGEYASDAHVIGVYDALAVEAVEVATRFPAYLKLPDRVETSLAGDVAAPIGSTVAVKLRTNNPLAEGSLRWQDGPAQGLGIADPKNVGTATFEVQKDGQYTFAVKDVDGQALASTVPFFVRALKDQPPQVEVKTPRIDIVTHPLGQVTVEGEAGDDFGVESVEFIYQVASETGSPEVRVPARFRPAGGPDNPDGKTLAGRYVFALEDLQPRVAPGTLITYYLECRDQKGQKAVTDIYLVTVTPFEQWTTWAIEPAEAGEGYLSSPLTVILAAAWHVHTQKDQLPLDQFNKQAEELAKAMEDPSTGEVFPFIKLKKLPPAKLELGKKVPVLAKQAHDALLAHDTAKALEHLRAGVAILTALGLTDSPFLLVSGEGGGPEAKPDSALAQITTMEKATADLAAAMGGKMEIVEPGYRRELKKAEEAEKLRKKAEELKKAEQAMLDRTVAMADKNGQPQAAPDAKPGEPKPGDQKPEGQAGEQKPDGQKPPASTEDPHGAAAPEENPAGGQPPPPKGGEQGGEKKDSGADMAADQRRVAQDTKATAMDARAAAAIDPAFAKMADKMDDAAGDMFSAAAKMAKGDMKEAAIDAERARNNLVEAAKDIQGLQRHSLEQAVDQALVHAEQIQRTQGEIRTQTEAATAKLDPAKKPDAGQQRDMRSLAFRQGETRVNMERLKEEVGTLRELVQKGAKPDTARTVEDAGRGAERHQVVQKMTNAAVELDAGRPAGAVDEQAKAEAGVKAVVEKLREAAGTLASDYKSELARAKFETDRAAADIEKLSGKDAAKTPPDPSAKPPTGPQTPSKEASAPMTDDQRRELGQQAASRLTNLARHMENRRLVPEEAGQIRKAAQDPNALARALVSDEAKREELLGVVRRAGVKLMAELEVKLQAERLKDFQREECPPQYRPLVNKYYELLSQTSRP